MKKLAIFGIIIGVVVIAAIVYFVNFARPIEPIDQLPRETQPDQTEIVAMKITSPEFGHNQTIPTKFTCDGDNVSPPLEISEVPENTVSLALIMDDPDAPGRTFVHWTAWNISPDTRQIPEGTVPQGGQQGTTDFGIAGYGGPCPPSGTHRYFFKLYALDTNIELSSSARKTDIEAAMDGHILAQTELIGLYARR